MNGVAGAIKAFFLHNWPQKLGALLAAVLIWWFAAVGEAPQTQASRVVDVQVQGLGGDSVASGVPDNAVVTIRGPSVLIERLQAQNLSAVIDLAGSSGSFERSINVLIPQGVELVSVTPDQVIGTIETVAEATVPVEAVLIGSGSRDSRAAATVEPGQVTVRGLASVLSRVSRVVVPVRGTAGNRTVAGFPADVEGLPVAGVTVEPGSVQVTVSETPVLESRTVSVNFTPPALPGFNVTARLTSATVNLVGPPSLLATLDRVNGSADITALPRENGSHTVPVVLELPDGVASTGTPTASVRLLPLNLEE